MLIYGSLPIIRYLSKASSIEGGDIDFMGTLSDGKIQLNLWLIKQKKAQDWDF